LKDVIVLVDKDRVKSGRFAVDKWEVDTLLLDDGFQYLHLKHRAGHGARGSTSSFRNEFMLPRGTLRERPAQSAPRQLYLYYQEYRRA